MFNTPLYKKILDDREWVCGTVSNGTFYWCEQSKIKDEESIFFKRHYQYFSFNPEQSSVLLLAIIENRDNIEIPEAATSVMIGINYSKANVDITEDTIFIYEEITPTFFVSENQLPLLRTHQIPKDIFTESMDVILSNYKNVPMFNFWKNLTFDVPQDTQSEIISI
jgi:hypothetical protein